MRYYLSVSDTYGGTITSPLGAPAGAYRFVAGPATILIDDDMETNAYWQSGAFVHGQSVGPRATRLARGCAPAGLKLLSRVLSRIP